MRILCLGDSYTIGEGVPECDRWPSLIVKRLTDKSILVDQPTVIARTGWTTDELLETLARFPFDGIWDAVTVMIGVNDQYRGRPRSQFLEGLRGVLDVALFQARQRPDKILAISIPDWGVTPFAEGRDRSQISVEIDAFNLSLQECCQAYRIPFLDITDISRLATCDPLSWLCDDQLHPSRKMHAAWAERIEAWLLCHVTPDAASQ